MRTARTSTICDRIRSQISLDLDGELSQLERAMLASHLERCPECRTYEADVGSFTRALRAAPLEQMQAPVAVRRARRFVAPRLQVGVAAAVAVAALGLASQLASEIPRSPTRSPGASTQIRYPSLGQIEREQAILKKVRSGLRIQLDGLVL